MPSTSLSNKLIVATVVSLLATMVGLELSPPQALAAEETTPPSPLMKLQAQVERAFGRCDAAMLRPILSRRFKTLVATRVLAPSDGYYAADQLLILFERLFEGRTTVRFKAISADSKPRGDGRASLPIRWISSDGGQSHTEVTFVLMLARYDGDWQIREIRDLK